MTSAVLALAAWLAAAPPPGEVNARLRAGQSAMAARDYTGAAKEFSAALSVDPANPAAHYYLGVIGLVTGDAASGLLHFSALPSDPRALVGKLDCELRLGRLDDARASAKRLQQVPNAGTLLARAASLLGTAEEKAGNLPAALRWLGEAARLAPANEDYRVDHAAVLSNIGDVEGSVAAFRAAAADFPDSARVHLGLGSALYLAGQHVDAARALLAAVRLEPGPRAFDLLGKAYEAAGELQPQIVAEFRKYLSTNPRDATAFTHYGAILHASGTDPAGARKALVTALEIDPKLAAAHLQLGSLEQSLGDMPRALQHFQRAAEIEPRNGAVHYRLGSIYGKLGQQDKAREELEKFRRLKVSAAP